MNDWLAQAKIRLNKERRGGGFNRYGEAMKGAVADALIDFAGQEPEFAQAIVQGGGFAECMKAVSGRVKGNAISDMEAFGAAVRFYFPGAELRVKMTVNLTGGAAREQEAPARKESGMILDLSDFF